MSIIVCHGGDPIPKSPFTIIVAPPLDLNKVKVQGLNNSKSVREKMEHLSYRSKVLPYGALIGFHDAADEAENACFQLNSWNYSSQIPKYKLLFSFRLQDVSIESPAQFGTNYNK